MSTPKSETCRSCRLPVIWIEYASGKRAPLDAKPTAGGTVVLTAQTSAQGRPIARVLTKAELADRAGSGDLYTSHFTTCPNADQWRRR